MKIKTRMIVTTMSLIVLSMILFAALQGIIFSMYMSEITSDFVKNGGDLQNISEVKLVVEDQVVLTGTDLANLQVQSRYVSLVLIVIIFLICLLFANSFTKRYSHPISLLQDGANRINENILTIPIEYNRKDEFYEVCVAFNNMQDHIFLAERLKSSKYEKARIDMITGISHDLRTPLTSIKGYIKGISDGVATTPEKQQQYLDIAYKKTIEMDSILNRLFNVSKLATGNLLIEKEYFELTSLLKDYSEELVAIYEGVQITIENTQKVEVYGDVEQTCQVISNLVTNSVKYADVPNLQITIKVEQLENEIRLRFIDNGVGVPEVELKNLFKQFYRVDKSRSSTSTSGSGLGLYIVQSIVEAHDGNCRAYNDGGLVVEIILPIVERSE